MTLEQIRELLADLRNPLSTRSGKAKLEELASLIPALLAVAEAARNFEGSNKDQDDYDCILTALAALDKL